MTNQIIGVLIKGSLVFGSWYFAQIKPFTETGIIDKAFDNMFSLGLMVVFLVYMVYENRKKDKQKDVVHGEYVELLKANITAIEAFAQSNKDIAKSVERSAASHEKALETMTKAFEKLEYKL